MNATADLFPGHWNRPRVRDERAWLDVYRAAEAACEAAAEAVRAACEGYKAERSPATEGRYRDADRAYNRARADYQTASYEIVTGIRAIAGIARAVELALGARERLL
jgi:hypothetical protein